VAAVVEQKLGVEVGLGLGQHRTTDHNMNEYIHTKQHLALINVTQHAHAAIVRVRVTYMNQHFMRAFTHNM